MQFNKIFLCSILSLGSIYASDRSKPEMSSDCYSLFPEKDCGWTFKVGLLLERMQITNQAAFVVTATPGEAAITETVPAYDSKIDTLQFNVDPGISVFVSKEVYRTDWRFNAGFEWLSSIGKKETKTPNLTFLYPLNRPRLYYPPNSSFAIEFTQANAKLSIDYYLLDLYINSKALDVNGLSLAPYGGVKLTWIDMNRREEFLDDVSEDASPAMPADTSWLFIEKINFWCIGPMVGLDGKYCWGCGWSIYSTGNIALLLGNNYYYNTDGFNYPRGYILTRRVDFTQAGFSSAARGTIGLQYEREILERDQQIAIKAGFDGRYYVNPYFSVSSDADFTRSSGTIIESGARSVDYQSFGMFGFILEAVWSY